MWLSPSSSCAALAHWHSCSHFEVQFALQIQERHFPPQLQEPGGLQNQNGGLTCFWCCNECLVLTVPIVLFLSFTAWILNFKTLKFVMSIVVIASEVACFLQLLMCFTGWKVPCLVMSPICNCEFVLNLHVWSSCSCFLCTHPVNDIYSRRTCMCKSNEQYSTFHEFRHKVKKSGWQKWIFHHIVTACIKTLKSYLRSTHPRVTLEYPFQWHTALQHYPHLWADLSTQVN